MIEDIVNKDIKVEDKIVEPSNLPASILAYIQKLVDADKEEKEIAEK